MDTCQFLGGVGWYWNFCAGIVTWFHLAAERTPITATGTSPNKVGTWADFNPLWLSKTKVKGTFWMLLDCIPFSIFDIFFKNMTGENCQQLLSFVACPRYLAPWGNSSAAVLTARSDASTGGAKGKMHTTFGGETSGIFVISFMLQIVWLNLTILDFWKKKRDDVLEAAQHVRKTVLRFHEDLCHQLDVVPSLLGSRCDGHRLAAAK